MRHLVVVLKLLLNKQNQEKGVTLLEVILVSVIIGIMAAISIPNTLEEQRRQQVNETFNRVRGALVEAQVNANRLSGSCTVVISATEVSSYLHVDDDNDPDTDSTDDDFTAGLDPKPALDPKSCNLEIVNIDDSIVSITKTDFLTPPTPITFSYTGTTGDSGTLWIKRTGDTTGNTAKCIVVSSLGMIRTGIYNSASTGNCENLENKRYTP